MAKYFYKFATQQEVQNWTAPQDQSWVAFCEENGFVGYSSDLQVAPVDDVLK